MLRDSSYNCSIGKFYLQCSLLKVEMSFELLSPPHGIYLAVTSVAWQKNMTYFWRRKNYDGFCSLKYWLEVSILTIGKELIVLFWSLVVYLCHKYNKYIFKVLAFVREAAKKGRTAKGRGGCCCFTTRQKSLNINFRKYKKCILYSNLLWSSAKCVFVLLFFKICVCRILEG